MPDNLPNHYIVNEHPLRIINKCRSHSKGTLKSFLIGLGIIYIILNWVPELLGIIFPVSNVDLMSSLFESADAEMISSLPRTSLAAYMYALMFSGVFKLGEALFSLTYVRNRKSDYRALYEGFSLYLKTLGVYLLQVVIVAFWSIMFIIPGIIAALNFSQAFYILADDPSKGIVQVLSESKIMMLGNRMNYARLLIFYLPYIMIAYLPGILISEAAYSMTINEPLLTVLSMLAEIPVFAANGYVRLGMTVFYELLITHGFSNFRYSGQEAFRELENQAR